LNINVKLVPSENIFYSKKYIGIPFEERNIILVINMKMYTSCNNIALHQHRTLLFCTQNAQRKVKANTTRPIKHGAGT